MQRVVRLTTMAVAALTLLLALASSGGEAQAGAAIVMTPGFDCMVLDGSGAPVLANEGGRVNVETSGARIGTISCSGSGVANDTGRAQHFDYDDTGFTCVVLSEPENYVTENWRATVSASGQATLVCHIDR